MSKVFKISEQFVSTNQSGEAVPDVNQEYTRPRLPWVLRKSDRLASVNGKEFLLQNASGSLRYLGSDGKLGRFPAWYYKEGDAYEYEPGCAQAIGRQLDNAVESACGEVLGWFDAPRLLAGMVDNAVAALQSKALKDWVREGLAEGVELVIAPDAQGGVHFRLDVNGDYPTRYGGIGSVEVSEPSGSLQSGIALSVRAAQLIEMRRLGPFIRSEASVRVTRSKKDQRQAVLTWSSVAWEGSVMTMASIRGL